MKNIELTGTTDAAGDLTMTSDIRITGQLEKIFYDYTDGANTADFTITNESVISEPILTIANNTNTDIAFYPRALCNKVTDGSAFTNWADKINVDGKFKVVVAQGGATKEFKFIFFVNDNL